MWGWDTVSKVGREGLLGLVTGEQGAEHEKIPGRTLQEQTASAKARGLAWSTL